MSTHQTGVRIAIIGAGLGGIIASLALKDQLHYENFTIYEKSSKIGGTWRDNTYPGCSSDIPTHWYSVSTELNPYWSTLFGSQPEILAYWEKVYESHDLAKHTVLDTAVISAVWSEEEQLYHLLLENTQSGIRENVTAHIVIAATGLFPQPSIPKGIKNVEAFSGPCWHSARWRHDIDLTGKRIGIIGNGCSGAQIVGAISKNSEVQVINIAKTPQWFLPKLQHRFPSWLQWIFAHVPFVARGYRNAFMVIQDSIYLFFPKQNKVLRSIFRSLLKLYTRQSAPKQYAEQLIPTYSPGCKRLIIDPEYLHSLGRPNVQLVWDKVDAVLPNGVQLISGEVIPLDVIVYATGFEIIESRGLAVTGRDGKSLHQYWHEQGAPTAYLGTCIPDFPNYFILTGPNVTTGHASVVFTTEVQVQYALQLIKPIVDAKVRSFVVKSQASDRYNHWLQDKLKDTVWSDCVSWYRPDEMGKNGATFPGSLAYFWWLLRRPIWEDFSAVGASKWEKEIRGRRRRRMAILANSSVAVAVVGLGLFRMQLRSSSFDAEKWILELCRQGAHLGSNLIKF